MNLQKNLALIACLNMLCVITATAGSLLDDLKTHVVNEDTSEAYPCEIQMHQDAIDAQKALRLNPGDANAQQRIEDYREAQKLIAKFYITSKENSTTDDLSDTKNFVNLRETTDAIETVKSMRADFVKAQKFLLAIPDSNADKTTLAASVATIKKNYEDSMKEIATIFAASCQSNTNEAISEVSTALSSRNVNNAIASASLAFDNAYEARNIVAVCGAHADADDAVQAYKKVQASILPALHKYLETNAKEINDALGEVVNTLKGKTDDASKRAREDCLFTISAKLDELTTSSGSSSTKENRELVVAAQYAEKIVALEIVP